MKLGDLLTAQRVVVPLRAHDAAAAVERLVDALVADGAIEDAAATRRALLDRRGAEPEASEGAVLVRHARAHGVAELAVALGVRPGTEAGPEAEETVAPAAWCIVVAPFLPATPDLQTAAGLSRLLRQEGVVRRLLAASSPADVLAIKPLVELPIDRGLTVRDIMARTDSVPADMPLRRAIERMVRDRLRALPVTGEKGELVGILTEWDVLRGWPEGRSEVARDRTVRDAMTRSVLGVSEELPLEEAAQTMIKKTVEHLPVVSEGRLVGLLSRGDIIRKLFGP
jgi:CBS domain-containing protein